ATCHTTWFRPQEYFDVPWRGRWETEGGGPTMGHGIHQMDLLLALLGEWTEVSAVVRRQARDVETEDVSMARVDFANGAIASVVNSLLSPQEESRIRIDFENATVELLHLYGYGDEDWQITPAPGCEEEVMAAWKAGPFGHNSGHHAQIVQVLDAVRSGGARPVTAAEALRALGGRPHRSPQWAPRSNRAGPVRAALRGRPSGHRRRVTAHPAPGRGRVRLLLRGTSPHPGRARPRIPLPLPDEWGAFAVSPTE